MAAADTVLADTVLADTVLADTVLADTVLGLAQRPAQRPGVPFLFLTRK